MESPNIEERTVQYALRIVRVFKEIEKDSAGKILGRQLLRSGTSIGANVHEAQGGQSKADFIAKLSIAQKEAHETKYWLRLIAESNLVDKYRLAELRDETEQLLKILSKILINSKKSQS